MTICDRLFSLKGKTALITGGYKGIGRLFAETYAEAGANVAVAARNRDGCRDCAKQISSRYGIRAIGLAMDVQDPATVRQAVDAVVDEFDAVDVLVNSAGISGAVKPVTALADDELEAVLGVDFKGVFVTSREAARHMVKRGSGRIVNIASILGLVAARNMAGYCSSKAAVIHLTRVMALELVQDNVQVNALCPGYFRTELNRDFFDSNAGRKLVERMIPARRVGDLEELRSTALYLATAPAFLTGTTLCIDGGHTLA